MSATGRLPRRRSRRDGLPRRVRSLPGDHRLPRHRHQLGAPPGRAHRGRPLVDARSPSRRSPCGWAKGEFGGQSVLQPAAMDRAVLVCRTLADLARSHGATEIVAVATSATREAQNQGAFVRRLRDEAGIDVHVVSGPEEARLVFLGVLATVHLDDARALVVDIGGGSTEIALGGAGGADSTDSLRLGAIRLTSEFPEAGGPGPVPAAMYEAMRRRVQVGVGARAAQARRRAHRRRLRDVRQHPQPRQRHRPRAARRHAAAHRHLHARGAAQGGQAPADGRSGDAAQGAGPQPGARRHRPRRRGDPGRRDGGPRPRRGSRRSASAVCARAW